MGHFSKILKIQQFFYLILLFIFKYISNSEKPLFLWNSILYKNSFSGTIPEELGDLDKLELLDLRGNNMTGCVPAEIGHLLLSEQL